MAGVTSTLGEMFSKIEARMGMILENTSIEGYSPQISSSTRVALRERCQFVVDYYLVQVARRRGFYVGSERLESFSLRDSSVHVVFEGGRSFVIEVKEGRPGGWSAAALMRFERFMTLLDVCIAKTGTWRDLAAVKDFLVADFLENDSMFSFSKLTSLLYEEIYEGEQPFRWVFDCLCAAEVFGYVEKVVREDSAGQKIAKPYSSDGGIFQKMQGRVRSSMDVVLAYFESFSKGDRNFSLASLAKRLEEDFMIKGGELSGVPVDALAIRDMLGWLEENKAVDFSKPVVAGIA